MKNLLLLTIALFCCTGIPFGAYKTVIHITQTDGCQSICWAQDFKSSNPLQPACGCSDPKQANEYVKKPVGFFKDTSSEHYITWGAITASLIYLFFSVIALVLHFEPEHDMRSVDLLFAGGIVGTIGGLAWPLALPLFGLFGTIVAICWGLCRILQRDSWRGIFHRSTARLVRVSDDD